ncbi:uncharacterized protein isoform X1 [Leptinotarsa decemlineata]|uniref:uncharacterized protein isoform X1 n=1 Tax=Leptinotarsa decemlineata TaxID=7539 RepID=UPI003D306486
MGQFCILCGQCKNSSNHLYSVPKDENKRKLWMDAVRKYLPDGAFICSKHFPIHFIGEKKLLKGAKPSCMCTYREVLNCTNFKKTCTISRTSLLIISVVGKYPLNKVSKANFITYKSRENTWCYQNDKYQIIHI